jgi:hypothetical protein
MGWDELDCSSLEDGYWIWVWRDMAGMMCQTSKVYATTYTDGMGHQEWESGRNGMGYVLPVGVWSLSSRLVVLALYFCFILAEGRRTGRHGFASFLLSVL